MKSPCVGSNTQTTGVVHWVAESKRYRDQLDGDVCAQNHMQTEILWRQKRSSEDQRPAFLTLEYYELCKHGQMVDGQLQVLFQGDQLVAVAQVVRTPNNWTQVVVAKRTGEDQV